MESLQSADNQDIRDLWEQYEQASKNIASSTIAALWDNIAIVCKRYTDSHDACICAELVKLLLNTHALDMHYYSSDHASFDLAKRISKFWVEPGCPELVLKSAPHAQLLAFVCTKLSYMTHTTGPLRTASSIADILTAWTGNTVTATSIFKPAEVVGILYGNAAHAFYCDDVDDEEDLPGYLLRLHLPVLGMTGFTPNALQSSEVNLPNDMGAGA